jgi:hypothetical protein
VAVVQNFDQEQACAGFDHLRLGCALLHLHATLRIDVDVDEHVLIQDRFKLADGSSLIRIGDGLVGSPQVGVL